MTFDDINAVQFYQTLEVADTHKDKHLVLSSLHLLTTCGLSKKEKETFPNFNQIENLDITGLPFKKPLNHFHVSVSNLNDIKADAGGTVLLFYYLNKRELILLDISNKLITTPKHNYSNLI